MSERDEILRRLEEVFEDVLDADVSLAEHTTANEVEGWDSVKTVELIVAIERAFSVRFNLGEIAGLENVGQLVDRIASP
jgi:acyl carrier protein